jgi:hypothetical protein
VNRRLLRKLEEDAREAEREEQRLEEQRRQEEFNYLQMKYMHLPEYEELELKVEEILDALDLYGDDSEEALELEQCANEAREKWLDRARELEREESNGKA